MRSRRVPLRSLVASTVAVLALSGGAQAGTAGDAGAIDGPGAAWRAHDDARRLELLVTADEVRVARPGDAGGWTWGFALQRAGAPGAPAEAGPGILRSLPGGVERSRGSIVERFALDAGGFRHDLELRGAWGSTLLALDFAASGGLAVKVGEDGQSVTFRTPAGAPALVLRLGAAHDADGREPGARWERIEPVREGGAALRLVIDAEGLRFPITLRETIEVGKRATSGDRVSAAGSSMRAAAPDPAAAPPSNDECAGSEALPGAGPFPAFSSVVDLTDATTSGDPATPSCQPDVSRSAWFSFTPAAAGTYSFATCSDAGTATTLEDTVLAIYASTGACSGLVQLAGGCDDDSCGGSGLQSRLADLALTPGATYYVVAWSYGAVAPAVGAGEVQVRVDFAPPVGPPPANDRCEGAVSIPGGGPFPYLAPLLPDVSSATTAGDPGTPSCQPNVGRSVWYAFTPSESGRYTFSTCADGPTGTTVDDTVLAVFASDGNCSGFAEVAGGCDDDSCAGEPAQSVATGVPLVAGIAYDVVAWTYGATPPAPGNTALQLRVDRMASPANDACVSATTLPLDAALAGTTVAAFDDTRLPAGSACFTGVGQSASQGAGRDVAYRFTAPAAGEYSFRASGYPLSGNLVLYAAADCPAGPGPSLVATCLAAGNRTATQAEEIACLALFAGQAVWLYVDEEVATGGGPFTLEASRCAPEREPDDTPATAAPLACFTGGAIRPAADADFFALGSPEAGARVFAIADGAAANSADFDLRVTTATDTLEYDDFNNDTPFGSSAPNVAGTPLTGAPAFLRLSHYSAAAQAEPYRLCAVVQPPAARAVAEIEPDDTPATATRDTAAYFSGALAGTADVDLFAFDAAAGDLVMLGLDLDPLRNNTPWNGSLALLDGAGTTLVLVNDPSGTSSATPGTGSLTATTPSSPGEALLFRARSAGTYHARVAWSSGTPGDYLLSIAIDGQAGGQGDADGDGAPDASDCAPGEPAAWAIPGEAGGLVFPAAGAPSLLSWSAPADPGGTLVRFDLLRSTRADDLSGAACLLSGSTATSAIDTGIPATAWFYVVRAGNACGGNLGRRSDGIPRDAPSCP